MVSYHEIRTAINSILNVAHAPENVRSRKHTRKRNFFAHIGTKYEYERKSRKKRGGKSGMNISQGIRRFERSIGSKAENISVSREPMLICERTVTVFEIWLIISNTRELEMPKRRKCRSHWIETFADGQAKRCPEYV
ncbi:hypothetical protein EYC84_011406 [Monilinia fructicola]|uniref:Uncharacterized protein n=1 Tax=Monilinia fructicola TaxID=38448 RepID=A0A5M9J878_MONFR|nr:hypothetical protein EYC84_011406 [Monilinia fructicola]